MVHSEGVERLGFLLFQLSRRRWVAGFFAAWFVIVLSPLLPLRDHLTEYYLTIPLLGFSMLAAHGLCSAWMAGVAGRVLAVALLATYCIPGIMVGHATAGSFHKEAARNRKVVESVVAQARTRGVARILLTGVTRDLWESVILGRPFYLYGYYDVYVSSEDRPHLPRKPNDDVLFTTPEGASAMRVDPRVLVADLKQFE